MLTCRHRAHACITQVLHHETCPNQFCANQMLCCAPPPLLHCLPSPPPAAADARLQVQDAMPPEEAEQLCEQALGSNACELLFGIVSQHAGGKQSPAELKGVLRNISYTARQRSLPAKRRGFALPQRAAKSWYPQYGRRPDSSSWNRRQSRTALRSELAAALVLGVRARKLKLGQRLRCVAKADKWSSLRDKAGYKHKH